MSSATSTAVASGATTGAAVALPPAAKPTPPAVVEGEIELTDPGGAKRLTGSIVSFRLPADVEVVERGRRPSNPTRPTIDRPVKVAIKTLSPAEAKAAGSEHFAFRVVRIDDGPGEVPIEVLIDYSTLGPEFGGDWIGRAQLVKFPKCAAPPCTEQPIGYQTSNDLTTATFTSKITLKPAAEDETSPTVPPGGTTTTTTTTTTTRSAGGTSTSSTAPTTTRTGAATTSSTATSTATSSTSPTSSVQATTSVSTSTTAGSTASTSTVATTQSATTNAAAGAALRGIFLRGVVLPSSLLLQGGGGNTYGLATGSAGPYGDWSKTSLSKSSQWTVGGNSGSFNWSYPIPTAAVAGGPSPSLSLGYSSQAVDGLTSESNSQGGPIAPGWNLGAGGFIERKFKTCRDDGDTSTASGDQCWWAWDGMSLSLNGRSSELLPTSTSGQWRLKDDPGWKVTHFFGANNGDGSPTLDNDGENWLVESPDGMRYQFGLDTTRNTVWALPVQGNNSGEPCHDPGNRVGSFCYQAYRWNLDKVIDPRGNEMRFTYAVENNFYARGASQADSVNYVRDGYVTKIEYGILAVTAVTAQTPRIEFSYQRRCTLLDASCDPLPLSVMANWYDVPSDQVCETANCNGYTQATPSFFSGMRLREVRSYSNNALLDTLQLNHEYADNGEYVGGSLLRRLWLRSIVRVGSSNGTTSLPAVVFDSVASALPNRGDSNPANGVPQMRYYRVDQIQLETGGLIKVSYGQKSPCPNVQSFWDATVAQLDNFVELPARLLPRLLHAVRRAARTGLLPQVSRHAGQGI